MNWTEIFDHNRDALLRLVGILFSVAGIARGGVAETLPGYTRRSILFVLRPAESAVRRLIFAKAKGLTVAPRAARPAPSQPIPRGKGTRPPSFPLFDPRKRLGPPGLKHPKGPGPRLTMIGFDADPAFPEPKQPSAPDPDAPVSVARLCRRLEALHRALDDLPGQARRLARLRARRAGGPRAHVSPLRPGWPPGHRTRHLHEIDEILRDCHRLARLADEPPDTS